MPRRIVLLLAVVAAAAAATGLVAACGAGGPGSAGRASAGPADGSTLRSAWVDPDGDGTPQRGPGEPLRDRTDLAPAARAGAVLGTLGILTDPHVRDEESPARATVLDRLGKPFSSTFRPQDPLSVQVLVAGVRAMDAARPDAALVLGDVVDSAQRNELGWAGTALRGGVVRPDSGAAGYQGVQEASDPDPAYYRPDVDPPRRPGLLAAAQRPVRSPGLTMPFRVLAGNHDLLVAGEVAATPAIRRVATGDRLLVQPEQGLLDVGRREDLLRDGTVDRVLRNGLPGRTRRIAPDPDRIEEDPDRAAEALNALDGRPASPGTLDQAFDAGPGVRVLALDTIDRRFGSTGVVTAPQVAWLRRELGRAGDRWVLVASHQPLTKVRGGAAALALLDRDPRVLAALHGDTHRHRIVPRRTTAGGFWLVGTSSLADWPQQGRMLRVRATPGGGAVLETWAVDTAPDALADEARLLAHLDAQGGRPDGARGTALDRNVRLFHAPPR